MSELQAAVLELQSQLSALQTNTDPTKANMLKVSCLNAWTARGRARKQAWRGSARMLPIRARGRPCCGMACDMWQKAKDA
jgi:hypothetical protein